MKHYVAFYGDDRPHLWSWLLPPEWRHVLAFWFDPTIGSWVVFDPCHDRLHLDFYKPDDFARRLAAMKRYGARFLLVHRGVGRDRFMRVPLNCTTLVAHLIGTKSRALRPRALWSDLLMEGAEIVFDN
jgi:hypothetical protein